VVIQNPSVARNSTASTSIAKNPPRPPAAASALLKREIKLWGDVIRANNIAAQ